MNKTAAEENPAIKLAPSDPAEIRYSSGSSGQPKGIVRSHRKLLHGSRSSINSAHICPEDRLLALRRLSFGTNDMLKGLLAGATLCPFDITKDGLSAMADFISRQRITYFTSSSSIFRGLIGELLNKEMVSTIRLLQVGDEPLRKGDVKAYKRLFPDDCILMHRLSCGEAGNICQYFIDKNTAIDTPIVPVGYPVEDKEISLLDKSGEEVAPGETGEIAVRSRYLSSEYWSKPEMTSAKFIHTRGAGERATYLTGDLGRILPDGSLLYLGRKDGEIKIRGCKVALTEIEAALCEFESVQDAAVTVWDDESGEPRLVAYVVARGETQIAGNELWKFLKTKLPDYMIPSRFAFIATLPSINGKIDRQALPPVRNARPNLSTRFVAPRTPIECELANIWADLLSFDRIGIHDAFFELGGHSLSAARLVSRILSKFQVDLPLQRLLQSPTIAEMGTVIAEHQAVKELKDQEFKQIVADLEALSNEEAQRLLEEAEGH